MAIAYVALGSNLGDKKKNLQRALMLLMQQGVEVLQVSGYFATEPYGVTDQPQFLNAVCRVRTNLEPVALLRTLLATELAMGRVRLRHWGERNIDLDLLLYENVVMQTPVCRTGILCCCRYWILHRSWYIRCCIKLCVKWRRS